jgi:hypothetical protein
LVANNIGGENQQTNKCRYRVIEACQEEKGQDKVGGKKLSTIDRVTNQTSTMNISNPEDSVLQTAQGSRPRVQLRLEEEQSENVLMRASSNEVTEPSNRPRIYLQDDDPEFDDLDEEDPDDDLDI